MTALPKNRRLLAAVIALVAWTGLGIQFDASYARSGNVPETLWVMLRYFTVIVNLLVAILFTAIALDLRRLATPFALAGVMIAILLVGIVYHLLLDGMVELSGGAQLANLINHSATPILVPLYWLFAAAKGQLKGRAPLWWALLPLAYFGYALARGACEGLYAYPFMDVGQLGWSQTLITAVVMATGFIAAGYALVWLDRRLSS
jgi:hypothetical protein